MADRSDRFVGVVTTPPPCWTCKHKFPGEGACTAFPGGIPSFILSGENQHREPVDGDNGIQWEPEEPAEDQE